MENTFNLSLYSNDLSINFDTTVYEDLGKKDSSDKYEYILPKLSLIKKINTKNSYNGNFTFKSQATIRNYSTNIYERNNLNELIFKSAKLIDETLMILSGCFFNITFSEFKFANPQ